MADRAQLRHSIGGLECHHFADQGRDRKHQPHLNPARPNPARAIRRQAALRQLSNPRIHPSRAALKPKIRPAPSPRQTTPRPSQPPHQATRSSPLLTADSAQTAPATRADDASSEAAPPYEAPSPPHTSGRSLQADTVESSTAETHANGSVIRSGVCFGGMTFASSDEWWKYDAGMRWSHDIAKAWSDGAYPGSSIQEEWWGQVDTYRDPCAAYDVSFPMTTPTP